MEQGVVGQVRPKEEHLHSGTLSNFLVSDTLSTPSQDAA